ncbi:hypothetical protein BS50DRAFT_665303 [Corynespora cassiicola Philippines]|uniref:HD/PDEase domain-containing protein n=1 Tax=Corynespora cassiicola Philippines TaxID=1448308 RepID=A0A2T2NR39_CORCC|nr:hypothetical protein BS50DRAFT_665303 [Corynespora cassiicola Philippines]
MTGLSNSPKPAFDHLAPNPHLPGGYLDCSAERNQLLLDMDKLGIPEEHREMFTEANIKVREYMYGKDFDPSHDYEHVQRVVALAHRIMAEEFKLNPKWGSQIDPLIVYLGCMMHDVGERKYSQKDRSQKEIVCDMMLSCGASCDITDKVTFIATNVSFSREKNDEEENLKAIQRCPELAVVQDSDKLDAIGAIGIARCFVYGGIHEERKVQSIHEGIRLHHTRFIKYLPLMKTQAARDMAVQRWETMCQFRELYHQEIDVTNVL